MVKDKKLADNGISIIDFKNMEQEDKDWYMYQKLNSISIAIDNLAQKVCGQGLDCPERLKSCNKKFRYVFIAIGVILLLVITNGATDGKLLDSISTFIKVIL